MSNPEEQAPNSDGEPASAFSSANELRAITPVNPDAPVADNVRSITNARSVRAAGDVQAGSPVVQQLTPEIIERNREAAAERWERRSVQNYGDFKDKFNQD
jgi:hypothetical protein